MRLARRASLLLAFCSASSVDEVEQLKRDVAGAGMKLAFTCLPDTVDPRGQRGSERRYSISDCSVR
jgi:hypothetical protein